MQTTHRLVQADARELVAHLSEPVHLVLTSPPYPMIEMWDAAFREASPAVGPALEAEDGPAAFEAMHAVLDAVWAACFEVLAPGGLCCIDIGDATRTLGGHFRLYPNHARILSACQDLGFHVLPDILWRKPTNGPTKFMGSGMLPAGAYVTYEHEYVLVLRKGGKRAFRTEADKARRRRSAFFWEERNVWFSDLWEGLLGVDQRLDGGASRDRSAAFPVELAWRLAHMYSLQEDVILDPFVGTGTTSLVAAASGRSSVGVDLDGALLAAAGARLAEAPQLGETRARRRLADHAAFVAEREARGRPVKHRNELLDLPVMTRQETALQLARAVSVEAVEPGLFGVQCTLEPPRPEALQLGLGL